jgi:HK97 family phage prohead protease
MMPLVRCQDDDKPGWKWGDSGKCYTYTSGDEESEMAARKKAMAQAAAMGEFPGTGNRAADELPNAPVEFRDASVAGVNFDKRIIEVVAVPYEEPTMVEYRGEIWQEMFVRGSFDGIETRQDQIRVNRNHDKTMTVGKVVRWWPERTEGLVSEVRVAPTVRGDETLALANEDMLSASVGFAVRGRDQLLDKSSMVRRIRKAFIDHMSFVESPAYVGARVLAVRDGNGVDDRPRLDTPVMDELIAFLDSRKG